MTRRALAAALLLHAAVAVALLLRLPPGLREAEDGTPMLLELVDAPTASSETAGDEAAAQAAPAGEPPLPGAPLTDSSPAEPTPVAEALPAIAEPPPLAEPTPMAEAPPAVAEPPPSDPLVPPPRLPQPRQAQAAPPRPTTAPPRLAQARTAAAVARPARAPHGQSHQAGAPDAAEGGARQAASGSPRAAPAPQGDPPLLREARYRSPPAPPVYPQYAIAMNQTGTVILRALVGRNGETRELRIWRSSGHPQLDRAATEAARRWAFAPASMSGQAIEAWVEVPVHFRLN